MTRDLPRGTRVHLLIAAALIAMHALLAWTRRVTNITTGNDDSVYLLLARSLLGGQYRDLFLVDTPVHTQYPPGYPALLALLGAPADGELLLVVAVNILLSCAALALAFDLLRRRAGAGTGAGTGAEAALPSDSYAGAPSPSSAPSDSHSGDAEQAPTLALLTLAALVFNSGLVSAASHVQSEPLFMALTMLAIWAVCTRGKQSQSVRWTAVIIAAAIGGTLVRSAGVAIIGGIFIHWLLRRRWRAAGALALAAAIVVGPWLVWIVVAPRKAPGRSYVADAMLVAPGDADGDLSGAAGADLGSSTTSRGGSIDFPLLLETIGARVVTNAPLYLTRRLPTQLRLPTTPGVIWDNAFWLLVIVAGGVVGSVMLWRSYRVIVLILLCYCTLLLLWPYALGRFLSPVLPLILALITFGLWRIGTPLARRAGDQRHWIALLLPGAFSAVLLIAGATSILQRGGAEDDCEAPSVCGGRVSDARYIDFVAELDPHLPAGARIFTAKEGAFYYLTGRRSVPIYAALGLDSAELEQFLRERDLSTIVLTHLVVEEQQLAEPLRGMCAGLRVITADPPELLALSTSRDSSGQTDACASLEIWNSAW